MSFRLRLLVPLLATAACIGDAPPESATPDATAAAVAAAAPSPDFAAGEVIVRLHDAYDGLAPLVLGGRRLVPIQRLPSGTWHMRLDDTQRRAHVDVAADTLEAIDAIARDASVASAHVNAAFELSMVPSDPAADPYVGAQRWSLLQIRAYDAWNLTTGHPGISVALLDSGRREHPDLQWGEGYDFVNDDADPTDPGSWAHGIHVAGIVGARANNGLGGAGLCWNCQVLPYRVAPGSQTFAAQVELALYWAAGDTEGERRADVVNMSFNNRETNCDLPAFDGVRAGIAFAISHKVTVVASAGNLFGLSYPIANQRPRVPATCPGVLAVMASNSTDGVPAYTARGLDVDVVAPGGGEDQGYYFGAGVECPPLSGSGTTGVFSTWSERVAPDQHPCYRHLSGTSMAAPHVAGVAALMRSVRPGLTAAQTKAVLRLTARPSGAGFVCSSGPGTCGAGRIDAYAAVDAVDAGAPAIAETAPNFHDFGTVAGIRSRAITLANIGFGDLLANTAPMQLVGGSRWFHFTGACSGQSCDRAYQLFPGGSITTDIACEPTAAGVQTAELVYHHTGVGEARVQLACASNGAGVLTAPSTFALGNIPVGATGGNFLTLGNSGPSAVEITGHSVTGGVFSVVGSTVPSILSAGATANVIVLCSPLATASYVGALTVTSTGGSRTVQLTCTGAVPVLGVPATVAFGPVRVGASLDGSVAISNPGGAPLTITAASLGPEPEFEVISTLPMTVAAGATRDLVVRCTPPSEATVESTLQLDSNAGKASVGLSCAGVVPRLVVSPSTMYFGPVAVQLPQTRSVTLRNAGSGALTVTHVFVSGGAFSVSTVNVVLAPGATRAVPVTCRPFTGGTVTGYLEARSDGGDRRISLTCFGVVPQLDAPPALVLPDAPVGGASTALLELSNPTDVPVTVTGAAMTGPAALAITGVPSTIAPGEVAWATVRCAPTATGDLVGRAQVEIEGGAATSTEVRCRAVAGGELEVDPVDPGPTDPILVPIDPVDFM